MLRAIKILIGIMLVLSSCLVQAFPKQQRVPGGVAIIPLGSLQEPMPQAYFNEHLATVIPSNESWLAVLGIPLNAVIGQQILKVTQADNEQLIPFEIQDKKYRLQRVRIKDHNKVEPDEESSTRIIQELGLQKRLVNRFQGKITSFDFIRPIAGRDSGRFGARRLFNGQMRQPHSGMDIASPTGTPVKVTAAGQVIYTGNLFFSGNVVYVDHGSGVISLYAHLSKINVQVGDDLKQGDIVGLVGKTGRATGPHLHWSIYLNGTAVNPALFL